MTLAPETAPEAADAGPPQGDPSEPTLMDSLEPTHQLGFTPVPGPPPARQDAAPQAEPDDGLDRAHIRELIAAGLAKSPDDVLKAIPAKLSPSRTSDFLKCPQKFFYKTICGIAEPSSVAALRGNVFHGVAERIFDHPAEERNVETALSYIEPVWKAIIEPNLDGKSEKDQGYAIRDRDQALAVITPGTPEEAEMLESARECVRRWFQMERVFNFTPVGLTTPKGKEVDGRELYVAYRLAAASVVVHGFIDRLDSYTTSDGRTVWTITDYKTSENVPWLKKRYSPEATQRIRDEYFFQLYCYAVVVWLLHGIHVSQLRLVYLGGGVNGVQVEQVTKAGIDRTMDTITRAVGDMRTAARTGVWQTKTSPLCDYCFFKQECPAWTS